MIKKLLPFFVAMILLNGCGLANMGADATKYPPDPKERVKRNIEEGRGFRLMDEVNKGMGGNFEFASSNELWRASLDIIDFMPLASANYSGGIIITDWYSSNNSLDESIKISIRFLTNQIRSDALDIKVFYKKCAQNESCIVNEKTGALATELKKKILTKAMIYEKENKDKNFREYKGNSGDRNKSQKN